MKSGLDRWVASALLGLFALLPTVPASAAVVYVADQLVHAGDSSAKVLSFSSTSGAPGTTFSGFGLPTGLALDALGNLYALDLNLNQIHKFSPTGADLGVFVNTGLSAPSELAFDQFGNVYVSNRDGNTVVKYSPTGVYLGVITSVNRPRGLAFDQNGKLYVASQLDEAIYQLNADGTGKVLFADSSVGVSNPRGLAFDITGNLYVANNTPDQVLKLAPNGLTSMVVSSFGCLTPDPCVGPNDLAFDSSGNFYIALYYTGAVRKFAASGTDLGNLVLGLDGPGGLTVGTSAVPEPGTFVLLGAGLSAVALVNRRRRT